MTYALRETHISPLLLMHPSRLAFGFYTNSFVAGNVVIGLIDFYRLRPKSVAVQVNK
jgi:hypothetical protein